MPYTESEPIIFSEIFDDGRSRGTYATLPSNGKYVRGNRGLLLGPVKKRKAVAFVRLSPDGHVSGNITDEVLCDRLQQYFSEYYENRNTNCSAFAHFLVTGDFQECQRENGLLVAHHHMRNFRKGQRVSVGDMLCLMYCNDKLVRSRKAGKLRRLYLDLRKSRHDDGETIYRSLRTRQKVADPDLLHEIHQSALVRDFHFMVCVAKHHGQPVWLSQMGRRLIGDDPVALCITIGDEDPCPEDVPLLSLIKRRRQ